MNEFFKFVLNEFLKLQTKAPALLRVNKSFFKTAAVTLQQKATSEPPKAVSRKFLILKMKLFYKVFI